MADIAEFQRKNVVCRKLIQFTTAVVGQYSSKKKNY